MQNAQCLLCLVEFCVFVFRGQHFLSDPSPIIALPCQSVTPSSFLRLDWCDPGLWRFSSDPSLFIAWPCQSLSQCLLFSETWLMWPWRVKITRPLQNSRILSLFVNHHPLVQQLFYFYVWSKSWNSVFCRWSFHGKVVFVVCFGYAFAVRLPCWCCAVPVLLLCDCLLQNLTNLEFA